MAAIRRSRARRVGPRVRPHRAFGAEVWWWGSLTIRDAGASGRRPRDGRSGPTRYDVRSLRGPHKPRRYGPDPRLHRQGRRRQDERRRGHRHPVRGSRLPHDRPVDRYRPQPRRRAGRRARPRAVRDRAEPVGPGARRLLQHRPLLADDPELRRGSVRVARPRRGPRRGDERPAGHGRARQPAVDRRPRGLRASSTSSSSTPRRPARRCASSRSRRRAAGGSSGSPRSARRVSRIGGPVLQRMLGVPMPQGGGLQGGRAAARAGSTELHKLLADPDQSTVRIVLALEKMSIAEAQRSFTYFHLFGYPSDLVVANRVLPPDAGGYFARACARSSSAICPIVEQEFGPVPVRTVPHVRPRDGRHRAAAGGRRSRCSATATRPAILYRGRALPRCLRENGGYVLKLELPFTAKERGPALAPVGRARAPGRHAGGGALRPAAGAARRADEGGEDGRPDPAHPSSMHRPRPRRAARRTTMTEGRRTSRRAGDAAPTARARPRRPDRTTALAELEARLARLERRAGPARARPRHDGPGRAGRGEPQHFRNAGREQLLGVRSSPRRSVKGRPALDAAPRRVPEHGRTRLPTPHSAHRPNLRTPRLVAPPWRRR